MIIPIFDDQDNFLFKYKSASDNKKDIYYDFYLENPIISKKLLKLNLPNFQDFRSKDPNNIKNGIILEFPKNYLKNNILEVHIDKKIYELEISKNVKNYINKYYNSYDGLDIKKILIKNVNKLLKDLDLSPIKYFHVKDKDGNFSKYEGIYDNTNLVNGIYPYKKIGEDYGWGFENDSGKLINMSIKNDGLNNYDITIGKKVLKKLDLEDIYQLQKLLNRTFGEYKYKEVNDDPYGGDLPGNYW